MPGFGRACYAYATGESVYALTKAGDTTTAAFSLGTLEANAAPEEASSTYAGDSFSAQVKFHLKDWYPLEKALLFDGSGALLRTDALTTTSAEITYSFPDLFGTDNLTRDFDINPSETAFKPEGSLGSTQRITLKKKF